MWPKLETRVDTPEFSGETKKSNPVAKRLELGVHLNAVVTFGIRDS
jgi:hypothetical protein